MVDMAEKWVQNAIKKPGSFTAQAKRAGEGVQEFAGKVSANPDKYSATTRRRATLARTLAKMHK
jgi:hypothetical protein